MESNKGMWSTIFRLHLDETSDKVKGLPGEQTPIAKKERRMGISRNAVFKPPGITIRTQLHVKKYNGGADLCYHPLIAILT